MSISSNYDAKINNNPNVTSSSLNTTVKSSGTQNTVFENTDSLKKKIQLGEKELKYLISKGYDVSKLSDLEIQNALQPYYAEIQEATNNPKTPESAQQDKKNVEINIPKDLKVDYNAENLKKMDFEPKETGVYACDFYNLNKSDQSTFFVKNFAKKYFGEQWSVMTEAQQAEAMERLEADLSANIPSWKKMINEDKGKLALAFFAASDDVGTKDLRFDGDIEKNYESVTQKPLNVQIENTITTIVEDRENLTETVKEKFNKEMDERFGRGTKDFYDKQLNYLRNKVQQDGIESLNEAELDRYKLLDHVSKTGIPLNKVFGRGKLNPDKSTSTFELMKNDEEFQKMVEFRSAQLYQSTNDKESSDRQAKIEAAQKWFIKQFDGIDNKDKKALVKKYIELRNNCHTPEEQAMLHSLSQKVRGLAKVNDNLDAIYHTHVASSDAQASVEAAKDVAEAHLEGNVNEEVIVGLQKAVPETVPVAARSQVAIQYNRVSTAAAKELLKEENLQKYSAEQHQEIFEDVVNNSDQYTDKNVKNVFAENIGKTDDTVEMSIQKTYTKTAVKNKDGKLMQSIAKGTSEYSKANQVEVAKDVMQASNSFDKEDAIAIQTTLADQISKSHKDNQLAMHKEVMKSEYSEVQEYAASNIKNYDPSVQSKAIDVVYESGNSKAVQKVIDNLEKMPPEVQKNEVTRLIGEITLKNSISVNELEAHFMGGELTVQDLSKMSASQRREYFLKQFEEASPAKKLEILLKMASSSNGIHQRTIYTVIARFSPSLLKGMVDRGMGKTMLEAGLPLDAVNKIIGIMKISTNNEVIQQLKELRQDSGFAKYFDKENESALKMATTVPPDFKEVFSARIDRKTMDELKKNKSTMYLKS